MSHNYPSRLRCSGSLSDQPSLLTEANTGSDSRFRSSARFRTCSHLIFRSPHSHSYPYPYPYPYPHPHSHSHPHSHPHSSSLSSSLSCFCSRKNFRSLSCFRFFSVPVLLPIPAPVPIPALFLVLAPFFALILTLSFIPDPVSVLVLSLVFGSVPFYCTSKGHLAKHVQPQVHLAVMGE